MKLTRREVTASLLAGLAIGVSSLPAIANNGARRAHRPQPNRARANRLIRQSDKKGGHFSRRHVGKPLSYLKARATTRNARRQFRTAARRSMAKPSTSNASKVRARKYLKRSPKRQKRAEFSTFADPSIAQASLARALTRNETAIRAWLRGNKPRLTIQTRVPRSAGAVYLPGSGRVVQPKKAIFVLHRDGRAFRLHTGYLTSNGVGKL